MEIFTSSLNFLWAGDVCEIDIHLRWLKIWAASTFHDPLLAKLLHVKSSWAFIPLNIPSILLIGLGHDICLGHRFVQLYRNLFCLGPYERQRLVVSGRKPFNGMADKIMFPPAFLFDWGKRVLTRVVDLKRRQLINWSSARLVSIPLDNFSRLL